MKGGEGKAATFPAMSRMIQLIKRYFQKKRNKTRLKKAIERDRKEVRK